MTTTETSQTPHETIDNGHGPISIIPSDPDREVSQKQIKKKATGLPAVLTSFRYAIGEAGPLRGTLPLLQLNQADGFDCPGCAWPDPSPDERSPFEFCENGAKAVAHESDRRRITSEFFKRYSVSELSRKTGYWLEQQGRLTAPIVLRENATHYEPISWQAAYAMIAERLNSVPDPNRAAFYTSGKATNEAAFAYQLFARQYGTNNQADCSNMCHESSGRALTNTLGFGKGTIVLDDFKQAELVFVVGQNPGTNHPRQLTALQHAKRNGAKIVSINPLPETGLMSFMNPQEVGGMLGFATELTDLFLQVKINGDLALFKGIIKQLIEWDDATPDSVIDREFVNAFTADIEPLLADVRVADWDTITRLSGISRAEITQTAELVRDAKRIIICWCLGVSQHKNGMETIQEIINLLLLRGAVGKRGAGACCVRGHSNVQGDRTMGVWDKPEKELLDRIAEVFAFEPPREHGYDSQETILAMSRGEVDVFVSLGGNFLMALPDTDFVCRAMQKVGLTVRIGTKLNRADLVTGRASLILPCLGRTEKDIRPPADLKNGKQENLQFASTENSMGVVQRSQGKFAPASAELKNEIAIVCELAAATVVDGSRVPWLAWAGDYDLIRDGIASVIPGCEDYNERVRRPEGFNLPNGPRERIFNTSSGKAQFTVNAMPTRELESDEFSMTTVRSHDQFNTTIYGLHDRYRGLHNARKVVMMNRADLKTLGLKSHDRVNVTSTYNNVERRVTGFTVVEYSIPLRCIAMYYPEANPLIPIDQIDPNSGCPSFKHTRVRVSTA